MRRRQRFREAIRRLERISQLPKPPGAESIFFESFIHGFFGNPYYGYSLGKDADEKQKAIAVEAEAMIGAIDKADAVHQLLPKIAESYSASLGDSGDRISADIAEAWGPVGPEMIGSASTMVGRNLMTARSSWN